MITNIGTGYEAVYLAYKLNNLVDSAYKYQELTLIAKDSLYEIRIKNLADFQSLSLEEAMRLENLEKEKIETQSKIRTYSFLAVLAVLLIIGFILYRNNRQKQKANIVLQEQKDKVESTLHELKSTQSQLIQSEKMASLGELTAGIAHEIQNPLNFVNNFSEVSAELVEEMKEELAVGNSQLAVEIAEDIKQNLEKINHHGKRADAIVKGMLEHSKRDSGQKEPTDLNALADDFLRLTYQSFLAKDPNFKVELQTNLDPDLPRISVIPQDIGKVLLNLYSNAFYACAIPQPPEGGGSKTPTVTLSTSTYTPLEGGRGVKISVKDNGPGIPDSIKEKIFQPFFTTKPSGQGTGLGLSLSYDIVKAHGGELKVDSELGQFTTFEILLPA